jgi:hypothetical protein
VVRCTTGSRKGTLGKPCVNNNNDDDDDDDDDDYTSSDIHVFLSLSRYLYREFPHAGSDAFTIGK